MRLESGPAKADRNWQIVRAAIFLAFALWFVYDGLIGWPNENREEAKKILENREYEGDVTFDDLGDQPDEATLTQLRAGGATTQDELRRILGQPTRVRRDGTGEVTEYYASRWGVISASVKNGRIVPESLAWKKWYKDRGEIRGQFAFAAIPLPFVLYFLWRLYKAVTLRVVIDDEGMTYAGRRIAFADMTDLRDYSPKGWIDLYYKVGESERKLRLDNEKVRLFDEIVAAICEKKGFKNEVQEYAVRKAHEEAEAAESRAEQAAAQAAEDADAEKKDDA